MKEVTAAEIIERAQKEIGLYEGSSGFKLMIDTYNEKIAIPRGLYVMGYNDPWCAAWASLVMFEAGADVPMCAYCPSIYNVARECGETTQNPEQGCLVLYDWDNDGIPDHIGIVESVSANDIITIEGNVDNKVKELHRDPRASYIVGYVRPANLSSVDKDTEPAKAYVHKLKYGDRSEAVRALQTLLILRGYDVGPCGADRVFGNDTRNAVRKANWSLLRKDSADACADLWEVLIQW